MKLDAIDLKILAALQREGRMSKVKLAETVNLSPSPCWERLRRLEKAGIIAGYHARIDLTMLAKTATVWMEVTLRHHTQDGFDIFERAVQDVPEIVECWATGGGIDYLLKVVAKDVDAYQRLVSRLLNAEIGIDRYFTYIVTKPVKESPELPIREILGA